jgi:hypothetical protein
LQQDIAAPPALRQLNNYIDHSPVSDLCYQFLDLRRSIKTGEMTDPAAILKATMGMEAELMLWKVERTQAWDYTTVVAEDAPKGTYFKGKRHIYSTPWIARALNNWRTLRIQINHIIVENESYMQEPNDAQLSIATSVIQQMSTDICISVHDFQGSARKFTPLYYTLSPH